MLTTSKGLMNPNLCKICGSRNLKSFAHTAKCANCGVLLYYPYPPSDSDLDKDGVGKYSPQESFLKWYSQASFYNHTNFTNMLRFTMDESLKNRNIDILDYGCGGGQFALVCKSHFPQATVFCTDICDDALLEVWKPMNIQIPFRSFDADKTKFDVIFLNDVFEHVSDPLFVLKQLTGKLKEQGLIFIDTPKQFWIYPITRLLSKRLYTRVLKGTVSTAHLQIWTKQSFQIVAKECGLEVKKFALLSEYTMPANYYLKNMGIDNPILTTIGNVFYRVSRYAAKNKIMSVLGKSSA